MKTYRNLIFPGCLAWIVAMPLVAEQDASPVVAIPEVPPSLTPAGVSGAARISADGSQLFFQSDASDLLADPLEDPAMNIFSMDLSDGEVRLVSDNGSGNGGGNGASGWASVSADGRWVAFASAANNLSPQDVNPYWDVYLANLESGVKIVASRRPATSTPGSNGHSRNPSISGDGNWVAFESRATDLTESPPDADQVVGLYRHDTQELRILMPPEDLIFTDPEGPPRPMFGDAQITADGGKVIYRQWYRKIVLPSGPSDWVPTNYWTFDSARGILIYDVTAGTHSRPAFLAGEGLPDYRVHQAVLSGDGSSMVIQVNSADDAALASGLYHYDLASGVHRWIDADRTSNTYALTYAPAIPLALSADGQFVVYGLRGSEEEPAVLMAWQAGENGAGITPLLTIDSASWLAPWSPAVSPDRRYVAFVSDVEPEAPFEPLSEPGLFVLDRDNSMIHRIPDMSGGEPGVGFALADCFFGPENRWLYFQSADSRLLSGDRNGEFDLFRYSVGDGSLELLTRRDPSLPPAAGRQIRLQWSAVPGATYLVEFSLGRAGPSDAPAAGGLQWYELTGPITASGDPASATDPNNAKSPGARLYRVRAVE